MLGDSEMHLCIYATRRQRLLEYKILSSGNTEKTGMWNYCNKTRCAVTVLIQEVRALSFLENGLFQEDWPLTGSWGITSKPSEGPAGQQLSGYP